MKKSKTIFTVVLLCLVIMSCSLFNLGGKFTPPTWIQGTWSDALDITSYIFESNNVTQSIAGYEINLGLAYLGATITETSNDSLYEYSIDQSGSVASYTFEKSSDTTLNYSVTASGTTTASIEMTKE